MHEVRSQPGRGMDELVDRVLSENLTYLSRPALRQLARAVRSVERAAVPGAIVEAGTALGGSAIVMATAKRRVRPMYVYDLFGMIPPPGDNDDRDVHHRYQSIVEGHSKGLGGEVYYGYRENLLEDVRRSFTEFGLNPRRNSISLVPGLFQDTIPTTGAVALAHLDGDWYASTMTCLERIVPRLSVGGRLVVDDYKMWSGCRTAVDEYFSTNRGCELTMKARLHIVRVEPSTDGEKLR